MRNNPPVSIAANKIFSAESATIAGPAVLKLVVVLS
jgi:hypothetical protein